MSDLPTRALQADAKLGVGLILHVWAVNANGLAWEDFKRCVLEAEDDQGNRVNRILQEDREGNRVLIAQRNPGDE